ncbi:ovarian cancer-associated gene 2 protein [Phytophthora cinnamomi]|uniref:ovarian cancer-associated gene 2 protein n=1 Tax=Phytophthora cinnamomi TaxID=4785 RepID=UPI00355AA87A|nr:ovarian cancer-associated gene 2 protein [Phytophthora cinnamomi]
MTAARLLGRSTERKLRLLCLHGMYQDAATFSAKTKSLRGADASVDFVFLNGPFTVVPPILARQSKRASASCAASSKPKRVRCAKKTTEFRAWWRPLGIHQEDPGSLDGDRGVLLAFLRAKLDEVGDVDGVVGFSQGASLAAWMCSREAREELQWSPKLAVLVGSYLGSPQYSLDSGVLPGIASLHVFGSNDYVIPAAKSQQVVDIFKQEETIENRVLTSVHSQGHVIPKCDDSRELFESFLTLQQLRLLGSPSISPSAASEVVERDLAPSEALASQRVCAL